MGGHEGILLPLLVHYLSPVIVCLEVWVLVVITFWWICELPSAGVGGGEELVEVLRHPVCRAKTITGAMSMGLTVDAEMF
jgi:hypothetical protein